MIIEIIFGAAGGLGLFLCGMGLMSKGGRKVAAEKMTVFLSGASDLCF